MTRKDLPCLRKGSISSHRGAQLEERGGALLAELATPQYYNENHTLLFT